MPRAAALVLLVLHAAAPFAAAEEPPGVALLVRESAEPVLLVDGTPASTAEVRDRVALRLAQPPPLAIEAATTVDGSLRVVVTALADLPPEGLALRVAATANGLVVEERGPFPIAPRRDAPVTVEVALGAHGDRRVAWVVAVDDPTGRFATGETLQAIEAGADPARAERRVVLVEVSRCDACAEEEAAARAVASEFAVVGAHEASAWRYARPLPPGRAVLAVVLVGVASLVLVPWRRAA